MAAVVSLSLSPDAVSTKEQPPDRPPEPSEPHPCSESDLVAMDWRSLFDSPPVSVSPSPQRSGGDRAASALLIPPDPFPMSEDELVAADRDLVNFEADLRDMCMAAEEERRVEEETCFLVRERWSIYPGDGEELTSSIMPHPADEYLCKLPGYLLC